MRKMILIIAIITMPFMSFSQTENDTEHFKQVQVVETVLEYDAYGIEIEENKNEELFSYRKVEPFSDDPLLQNKMINAKKSKDLISIKAYIKSLQMKRKSTLMT